MEELSISHITESTCFNKKQNSKNRINTMENVGSTETYEISHNSSQTIPIGK